MFILKSYNFPSSSKSFHAYYVFHGVTSPSNLKGATP